MSHDSSHDSSHGDHGGDAHGHAAHDHGPTSFWTKYVFSIDHKIIGLQFMFTSLIFVIVGGLLALGVRYELAWPSQEVPHKDILPGKMTDSTGSEMNLAAWKAGGRLKLNGHFVLDGNLLTAEQFGKALSADLDKRYGTVTDTDKDVISRKADEALANLQGRMAVSGHDAKYDKVLKKADRAAVVALLTGKDGEGKEVAKEKAVADAAAALPSYLPKDPPGSFVRFVDGIAVTVPYGTPVKGNTEPLAAPRDGYLRNASAVMADYQVDVQAIRAKPGVEVFETKDSAEPLVLTAGPAYQRVGTDVILLQQRPAATKVVFEVAGKTYGDKPASEGAAEYTAAQLWYPKTILKPEAYNQLFTMHASVMIFFVIIPMLVGAFGNFLVPLMIGARDMAFPKLNMLSFWLAMPAGIVMIATMWIGGGPAGGGWTMYPPLSSLRFSPNLGTTLWVAGVALVGFSSIVGALNYITTTINMRAPGMHLYRMPLTVWSILITSILALLATPVLTAAMIMLTLDRTLGTQFFSDTVVSEAGKISIAGGQPLMWQHIFWFYSHPAVYIMILPAMGVTSDILATFARKPIFGYKPMVFAMAAITGLGFIVWGHHMFQSGMNPVLGTTFMASTIFIAVPSAIKTFNWLGTLWGGNIKFTPSMLFALGFVSMFVIGGLSGIFMAAAPVDIHIHDTYFIVAHIHYVLFGGSIMAIFAGVYHWFPKMFGRQMNLKWGVIHFILTLIAFNGTFFLMHVLGIGGHPRRYATIMKYPTLQHLQGLNVVMTIFAMMLGTAQLPFFYNFFVSLPRKLGRIMAVVFLFMLIGPMVIGLSVWAATEGGATWLAKLVAVEPITMIDGDPVKGVWQFRPLIAGLGYAGLTLALIGVFVSMYRGLPTGGRVALVCCFVPILGLAVKTMGTGATLFDDKRQIAYQIEDHKALTKNLNAAFAEMKDKDNLISRVSTAVTSASAAMKPADRDRLVKRVSDAIAAEGTLDDHGAAHAKKTVMGIVGEYRDKEGAGWTKIWHDITVGVGIGAIFLALLTGAVWGVWRVGGAVGAPKFLQAALYIVFLPAFLAPAIFKHDTYLMLADWPVIGWFIGPATYDYRWLLMILVALPGALYLLLRKPQDQFGYDVGANPWQAVSLDWCATTSPPLAHGNFETIPVVHRGPYEYSSPVVKEDWIAQTAPLAPGEAELQASGH